MAREESKETTESGLARGTMLDHFRVERVLGSGGMATVYLAQDTTLGRKVALKVIKAGALGSAQDADRFLFEARAMARFNHPNIVTIYAVGEADGIPYLALEYVEGLTLHQLACTGPLELLEIVRIAVAIAEALERAHGASILHRDLKPGNVMIDGDRRVRVLDFGLARALPRRSPDDTTVDDALQSMTMSLADVYETKDGVRGTPAYMAPEQWLSKETSPRTDVWALGVVLYELICGKRPFDADNVMAMGMQVTGRDKAPAIKASCPAPLRDLIRDCLRKEAASRPDATKVLKVLRTVRRELEQPEPTDKVSPPAERPRPTPAPVTPRGLHDAAHTLARADEAYAACEFETALRRYSRIITVDSDAQEAWRGQLLCFLELEAWSDVLTWVTRALDTFPELVEFRAIKAVALERAEQSAEAQRLSREALKEGAELPLVWWARGDVLVAHNRGQAEHCFRRALEMSEQGWEIYYKVGRSLRRAGQVAKAREVFQRGVVAQPEHAHLWYWLGVTRRESGQKKEAIVALERAVELRPNDQDFRVMLDSASSVSSMMQVVSAFKSLWSDKGK